MVCQTRQERHDSSSFDKTAPQRVSNLDISRSNRVNQPRNTQKRITAQFQRIAEAVVHAPQNHVDLPQAFHGLQVDAPVTNRKISPFDKREPEVTRQVRMLEVCLVQGTWRQQYNAGMIA